MRFISSLIKDEGRSSQALWVALGSFSSMALSLVSAAILSRYLEKSDYGTYKQVIYVYNSLIVVFTAGLPNVFSYFLLRYSLSEGKNLTIRLTFFLFFSGLLFTIILYFCSDLIAILLKNPELGEGLRKFSIVPCLILPTLGLEGILATYKKTFFLAIYNVSTRTLTLSCIILPIILIRGDFILAIYGWICGSLFSLILAMYFKGIPFQGVEKQYCNLTYKEILQYGYPIFTASLAGMAIRAADQFYVSRFFGSQIFAEFANGFIPLPFVAMITGAAATVLMPLFSKLIFDKTKISRLVEIWKTTLIKSATLIYPLVIFAIINAKLIIVLLYSELYEASAIYFQIASSYNFFNIVIFSPLLFALGETRFYARLHFVFAFAKWIIGYFVVVVLFNPIYVALLSVVLSILLLYFSLLRASKIMNIGILVLAPIKKLGTIAFHCVLAVLIVRFVFSVVIFEESLIYLLVVLITYISLLIISGPFFKIDYMAVLRPIIKRQFIR